MPPPPPHRVFQPPLTIAPGQYELPDEACFSPRSHGGHLPCEVEESDQTSALVRPPEDRHCERRDESFVSPGSRCEHGRRVVGESDEVSACMLRLEEDRQPEKKTGVVRHPTSCLPAEPDKLSTMPRLEENERPEKTSFTTRPMSLLVEEPDETSVLMGLEEDEQPEKTNVPIPPTPAPLTSAMAVAPVDGFVGRFSYPDVEIDLKAKTALVVDKRELEIRPALVKIE